MQKVLIHTLLASITTALSLAAHAEVTASRVEIPLVGSKCNDRVKTVSSVSGELRIPASVSGSIPAVVVLHSNAGIIDVGEFYIKALNAAGIATLEVDSYTPRDVRTGSERNAPVLCDRLQDAWGALVYLSKDQRFKKGQIGIAGFSSGAAVAIFSGMGVRPARLPPVNDTLSRDLVYAAHFALYPGCVNIMDDQKRIRAWINPGRPQN
jgi:hypothetical protein